MYKKLFYIAVLFVVSFNLNAQNLDSLKSVWDNVTINDNDRLNAYHLYIWYSYLYSNPDSALILAQDQYSFAVSKGLAKHESKALNTIGTSNYIKGNYDTAVYYLEKSALLSIEHGDSLGVAGTYNNIGIILHDQGNYQKAINYYTLSLKIKEKHHDLEGMTRCLNNIGLIYKDQDDIDEALKFYKRSLAICDSIKYEEGVAVALGNIGGLYQDIGKLEESTDYLYKSLSIRLDKSDFRGASHVLLNLALVNINLSERVKRDDSLLNVASKHLDQAIEIAIKNGDRQVQARAYINKGEIKIQESLFSQASDLADQALILALEVRLPFEQKDAYKLKYKASKAANKFKSALNAKEKYIALRDSIQSEENQKSIIRQQMKYEFEKAQLVKEQEEKENVRIETEKIERRNSLQYSVILVAILIVFGIVMSLGFLKVSSQFAEGLIFFAFLIFFEFLLVLTDPFVEEISNGEPMYKLLVNAILAGAIFPAHSFFERILKKRIIRDKF